MLPLDPVSSSIAVGLVVSLLFAELFGLAAGGMVVPGYLALSLDRPADIAFTGPGLTKMSYRLGFNTTVTDAQKWTTRASKVDHQARQYFKKGERSDLWKLVPKYYRKSAAEEKHEAQGR